MTTSGRSIAGHKGMEDTIIAELPGAILTRETITDEQVKKDEDKTMARSTVITFLLGCDRSQYGKLINDIENDFL
jgi:hypothetical protein